jgi:hypothetical protein
VREVAVGMCRWGGGGGVASLGILDQQGGDRPH